MSDPQSRLSPPHACGCMRKCTQLSGNIVSSGWVGWSLSLGSCVEGTVEGHLGFITALCVYCPKHSQCVNTAPLGSSTLLPDVILTDWGWPWELGQTRGPTYSTDIKLSNTNYYYNCGCLYSPLTHLCVFLLLLTRFLFRLQVNVTVDYIRAATGPGEGTPAFAERTCATVAIGGM